jgi:hypothetical protein
VESHLLIEREQARGSSQPVTDMKALPCLFNVYGWAALLAVVRIRLLISVVVDMRYSRVRYKVVVVEVMVVVVVVVVVVIGNERVSGS